MKLIKGRATQVVVFDTSLISESPSYLPHTITPHLLGHLLDSAYSSSLVELCGRDALPSNALLAEGGLFRKLSSGLDFSHLLLKIAERYVQLNIQARCVFICWCIVDV